MPEISTPDQLAARTARTARALAAATGAGRDLGLEVTDPKVLHDVFSVVVHLAPSPVVVRVPTVLPPSFQADLAAQHRRQRDELAVVGWLADRGFPVIPPSPLVPREPVQRDGFSMTFWQFVEIRQDVEPDYAHNAAATAELHAALRDYPGELPFLSSFDRTVTESLDFLESRPDLVEAADLERARREWAFLEPVVGSREGFAKAFPDVVVQTVHGDSPPANLVTTVHGDLHADFELVTSGPVERDLVMIGPDGEAAYDEAAAAQGLPTLNREVLALVSAAGFIQVVACLALVPQLPLLAEGLKPALEAWRSTTPVA
ncbi:phosphotransferase [Umezawaea endophytica]|uniref:Phosphotransferase n=1 Tax=Umezawaea endophytica TaxID=1654476 RepID=A0A9X3AHA2_9PSEU|nr:phosphotransferase [Umezawaea endophytica]MCS7481187.1 phosphotransferase [Umezawaea endophytica]